MTAGLWHRGTIAWIMVAAILPAAVVAVSEGGLPVLWHMVVTLAVIWGWQAVFLIMRAQPVSPIAIVTAVAVTIMAPGDVALWQLVLAVTFGTVIGEQVFGGWGRNIINAAVATLAFLYFAFPETVHSGAGLTMVLATVPAALLLVVTGIASWRLLVAALAGLFGVTWLLGGDPALVAVQGSLAFGLVFLLADPVTSCGTRAGRVFYGLLGGGLTALFGWADTGIDTPVAAVFGALLASLFAPLIDTAVIAATARKWRPRHG